ncbi:MAG TPA: hypothetical protein VH163_00865, partial [Gemmatimonadales bacterium]|nr:hypothetical protein [Gemmatimonadales bacterium]
EGLTGDLRVRHAGDAARIEVEPDAIPFVTTRLAALRKRFTELGFSAVEVDPRGYRRGSLLLDRATR